MKNIRFQSCQQIFFSSIYFSDLFVRINGLKNLLKHTIMHKPGHKIIINAKTRTIKDKYGDEFINHLTPLTYTDDGKTVWFNCTTSMSSKEFHKKDGIDKVEFSYEY